MDFSGCSINLGSSSPYTLFTTSSPVWTPATSSAFYATVGNKTTLAFSVSSAVGLTPAPGFSTKTPKVTTGGAALAGQRVNVLVATNVNGVWSTPKYFKSAWANAAGVVTFSWNSNTATGIDVRIQWPGSTTYAVSTSKALGAYWK